MLGRSAVAFRVGNAGGYNRISTCLRDRLQNQTAFIGEALPEIFDGSIRILRYVIVRLICMFNTHHEASHKPKSSWSS